MEYLTGKCVYEGIVIGKTYVDIDTELQNERENISLEEVEEEKKRLDTGIEKAVLSLKSLKDELTGKVDNSELDIIVAHLLLLEDPMYISDIKKYIEKKQKKAEIAVQEVTDKFVKLFENIDSPIYRQRGLDIKDVSNRLIDSLKSVDENYKKFDGKILITKEIYPTELLKLHKDGIKLLGMIMEYGGETSHVAILAKALKIPTLMGVKDIFNHAWEDDIILDTTEENTCVIVAPTSEQVEEYERKREIFLKKIDGVKKSAHLPSVTKDGVEINLYLNIGGSEKKLEKLELSNVAGVGLLRTELIYMKSQDFPSEDRQLELYKEMLENFSSEQSIVIRTLDIGADKQLSYFKMKSEANPFLGLRGIRFSLENREIFEAQLGAILRLSSEKNIKIMYPMITTLAEIREANKILEGVKSRFRAQGIAFDENIEVGIMVEVPSVIMMAEAFAKEVDFFSVGSNDLTQYILATDRLSESVGEMYNSYNPAVLRAINHIKKAADKYNKKISVCGEMAGEPKAIVALLSLGIRDLSMVETSILPAKTLVRNLNYSELERVKELILECSSPEEVKNILKDYVNY